MRFNGKVAIVTGSGQGIGKSIALALAAEGASVVTNNRKEGQKGGDAATAAAEIERPEVKLFHFLVVFLIITNLKN